MQGLRALELPSNLVDFVNLEAGANVAATCDSLVNDLLSFTYATFIRDIFYFCTFDENQGTLDLV